MTVEPRPAAALIVAREGVSGPEFLLLERSAAARFMPGAYVFPGGAVDTRDQMPEVYGACAGLDDDAASAMLGVRAHGLRYCVAAIREAFEECGLLFAYAHGAALARPERLEGDLLTMCISAGWRLAVDRLVYFAHWITPPGPVRFDTRFFLAQAPEGQCARLMSDEMRSLVWLGACEALDRHANGRLLLMSPTVAQLEELAPFASLAALMRHARVPRRIEAVLPPQ